MASSKELHDRYKDLAMLEHAFRTMKTSFEETRPVYVRKEKRTRGHLFVCTLAYLTIRYIWNKCKDLGFTQKYLIESLDKIQYIEYNYSNMCIKTLPSKFSEDQTMILSRLNIKLPLRV
jgi:transposase